MRLKVVNLSMSGECTAQRGNKYKVMRVLTGLLIISESVSGSMGILAGTDKFFSVLSSSS